MVPKRISYLFERFFDKTIQQDEREELAKWIDQAGAEDLDEVLSDKWQSEGGGLKLDTERSERVLSTVFSRQLHQEDAERFRKIPGRRKYAWVAKTAVAAVMLVATTTFTYIWFNRQPQYVHVEKGPLKEPAREVLPGGNRAMLTLADGSRIFLDSAADGMLARDSNSTVVKLANGQLAYRASTGKPLAAPVYNELTTPNGGQYNLILPDGSKAWLNAASSIRFPTHFAGNERRVQITGEVYFEIATLLLKKGQSRVPFIVEINHPAMKGEVEVWGTHFNVNTYGNEEFIKTTLLEGLVKFRNQRNSCLLKPGQQGQLGMAGDIKLVKHVELEEVVAWKNGYFQFENAGLSAILRQAARWYNLEIVYEGPIPSDRFTGKIERSVPLSRLLKWMQWSDVKFKISGNRMIVSS